MARQLAAAAVLDRLVEQVGVHEIVGKQTRPEPKDPQVNSHVQFATGEDVCILLCNPLCPGPWKIQGTFEEAQCLLHGASL